MKTKTLKIIFLALPLIILGISAFTLVQGATEVKELTGSSLAEYVKNVFNIVMMIAGGLAGLAFIIGAVQFMASAGNPTSAGEGKNRMISAALGLCLTLGSLLVLKAINPRFVTPNPKLELDKAEITGVYLIKPPVAAGEEESKTAYSSSVPSLLSESWSGFKEISYYCNPKDDKNTLPRYFLLKYRKENYQEVAIKEILKCETKSTLDGFQSYELIPIKLGVYLWADEGCTKIIKSEPMTSSGNIAEAKAITIINHELAYHIISEHTGSGQEGDCTDFYSQPITPSIEAAASQCVKLKLDKPSSLTIVDLDTFTSSGDGIKFFQGPFFSGGVAEISNARIVDATKKYQSYKIPDVTKDVKGPDGKTSETIFDYFTLSGVSDIFSGIKEICPGISSLGQQNCPGSIKVDGDYVIKLKATKDQGGESFCKIISADETTLFSFDIFFRETRSLRSLEVVQGDPY